MSAADPGLSVPLLRTPLHALHLAQGARMTPFAGYDMALHFRLGILAEHLSTRREAGLFDVSHMGQIEVRPRSGRMQDAALALETLTPADIVGLKPGRQRYALLTNAGGAILDDVMIANLGDRLLVVVNAGCKAADLAHLKSRLCNRCEIVGRADRALIALQGPLAEAALAILCPEAPSMRFMDVRELVVAGAPCTVSRSGYTGEDGFEIGMASTSAAAVATALLDQPGVHSVGLGARDSLRLEAGLCLYGSELSPETTLVEAALEWSMQAVRRAGGARGGGYPGAEVIDRQRAQGAAIRRVGLAPQGRAPVRGGAVLFAEPSGREPVGRVSSGCFSPSLGAPVAMGYVDAGHTALGTLVFAEVRGARLPVRVAATPFIPHAYKR